MHTRFRGSRRSTWAEGQPISSLMSRALQNPNLISLAAGFVDQESLPNDAVRTAVDAIWSEPQSARASLQYGTTPGFPPLREALLSRQTRADGHIGSSTGVTADRVVIAAGSNQLLHLVGECLLDPGDIVLCSAPTYLVYLGILRSLGALSIGVAADDDGMVPSALEERLQRIQHEGDLPRVKAVYLVTYFDNPRGLTMSMSRRLELLDVVKRWSSHGQIKIVEDAAYRDLRYDGDDVTSLHALDPDGDMVVLAGTFSKCFSPGLRVGWGILPEHLVEPVCNLKGNVDFGSPNFNQHLMAKIIELELLDDHIRSLCRNYQEKLLAMLTAAGKYLGPIPGVEWTVPRGGLYVWVQLPNTIDTGLQGKLFPRAVDEGVLYVPGQFCYPTEGEPVAFNRIRLSFGVQTSERIEAGVEALARAIEQVGG
jgi:2-aminoadipate transaminase